ncbi:hypothetical protein [Enterobacter chuandaensis]|uniref:hypothetical protein n=1 Tax=Enterobacter chuandaensis TaxID=2497875 RepID=UPI0022F09ED3|nr:hypothetical protein [Enterobacter chuandaensis]MDA4758785.1 hypothetical protein [Enterobacter chuandaensis]
MKLIEMEGFLRGKCLPGDMKVNETNAEYLVRKFAEAEARCAALAAENAGLKDWSPNPHSASMFEAIEKAEALMDDGIPELAMIEAFEILKMKQTPATDAFLAEVRNEAGARAIELFAQTLGSPYAVRDEKCYEDGFTRAIEVVRDIQAPRFAAKIRFAAQLRKGVQS